MGETEPGETSPQTISQVQVGGNEGVKLNTGRGWRGNHRGSLWPGASALPGPASAPHGQRKLQLPVTEAAPGEME